MKSQGAVPSGAIMCHPFSPKYLTPSLIEEEAEAVAVEPGTSAPGTLAADLVYGQVGKGTIWV